MLTGSTTVTPLDAMRRISSSRAAGMAAFSSAAEEKARNAGACSRGCHRARTPTASAGQSVRDVPSRSRERSTAASAAYTFRSSGPYTGTTGPGTTITSSSAAESAAGTSSKNSASKPWSASRASSRQFSRQTIKYRCTPQHINSCAIQVSTGQNRTGSSISG